MFTSTGIKVSNNGDGDQLQWVMGRLLHVNLFDFSILYSNIIGYIAFMVHKTVLGYVLKKAQWLFWCMHCSAFMIWKLGKRIVTDVYGGIFFHKDCKMFSSFINKFNDYFWLAIWKFDVIWTSYFYLCEVRLHLKLH